MIEIKDAIEIARILAKAPEGRLAMILSVFESAELSIEGLDELEAWAISGERDTILDIKEFCEELTDQFKHTLSEGNYRIPASDFSEFCKEKDLNQAAIKACLARRKAIRVTEEKDGKVKKYSTVQRIGGKPVRCVMVREDWKEAVCGETT